ncbi:MAG: hypothetical protein JNK54_08065 [Elusimicrobia bacterium]|nr:hypothetical protein [Elusimicrobiota bacterium]
MGSLQIIALLPLIFFVGIAVRHYRAGRWGDALWMCHLSNLLLAAGLFFEKPFLVFMALPWLLFGIPLWLAEAVRSKRLVLFSILTHFGGVAIGFYAAAKMGAAPGSWWASWLFALAAQGVSRAFTRPEWNVNVTHRVYDAWKSRFKTFRSFWLFCIGTAALILWIMDHAFSALFAPH